MSVVLKGLSEINDKQDRISYVIQNKGEILHYKKMIPKYDSLVVKVDESFFITPEFDVSTLGLNDDEVFAVSNTINFFMTFCFSCKEQI